MHDAILKNQLGEKTSQESFQKVFKPITTKLDDVALSNLKLPARKSANKKMVTPDYGLDEEEIQPEMNKQLVPKPPTYEESLADKLKEGKQIYVDPQYLPPKPEDLPPEYDEDEVPDYTLDEEDRTTKILEDLEVTDYDNVEKIISQPEMTPQKKKIIP